MHKYNKLFFSVLLFLAACKGGTMPGGIIKQPQMINLLTEIHIVDGSMYNSMQFPDSLYKNGTGKYLAIFTKYNTDSVQFKKSFRYYTSHPDIMATMYEEIASNLKQKTDSLNKLYQKQVEIDNKRRTDSLNKLPKNTSVQPVVPVHTVTPAQPVNSRTRPNTNPRISPPHKGHAVPVE